MHLLVVTDGTCPAVELRPVLALLARPTRVTLLAVADPPSGRLGPPLGVLDPAPTPLPAAVTDQLTTLVLQDGRLACEELRELSTVTSRWSANAAISESSSAPRQLRYGAQLVVFAGWRNQQRLRNGAVSTAQQRSAARPGIPDCAGPMIVAGAHRAGAVSPRPVGLRPRLATSHATGGRNAATTAHQEH